MRLINAIAHQIQKERGSTDSTLIESPHLLVNNENLTLFIQELRKSYFRRKPSYGVFDADRAVHTFQVHVSNYLENERDFIRFSSVAARLLRSKMTHHSTTGGYVIFAHFESAGMEFIDSIMLHNTTGFDLDDTLHLDVKEILETEKLDVANSINITKWQGGEEPYLSFLRGRKDLSGYFLQFIGCTDQTSTKQVSKNFVDALNAYADYREMDQATKREKLGDVFSYCRTQIRLKQDISLTRVSSVLDMDEPDDFLDYIAENELEVSESFRGDPKEVNRMRYVSYDSPDLKIKFDKSLINNQIRYNSNTNTLTIRNIPNELSEQFSH